MRTQTTIAAIVAACGICAPAFAQDSVSSSGGGLPGDALNPWADHCAAYVVDLAPLETSKGNIFGVAPIIKLTKTNTTNFSNLYSPAAISPATLTGVGYAANAYQVWEDAPGFGVNAAQNLFADSMNVSGTSSRFAVAISEFGTTSAGQDFNGVVGAFVNFDPSNPNRLYVARKQVAVNSSSASSGDSSQIGGVSLDAHGNVYLRADGNNASGPNPLTGVNIFRVRLGDRDCGVQNLISNGATIDATDRILVNSPVEQSTANNIPQRLSDPVLFPNGVAGWTNAFTSPRAYQYGDAGMVSSDPNHLDTSNGWGSDHRGSMASTSFNFLDASGAAQTYGILSKDAAGETRVLNAISVDDTGAVLATQGFELPFTITDNETGYTTLYTGQSQPNNYTGATLFRGGVGSVAIGSDQDGRGLFACMVNENGFADDFSNQMIVMRYNPQTGAEEWAVAAYVDQYTSPISGKPICDENGDPIGQIINLDAVTGGFPLGPGMSAPTIDSVGNLWFLSAVELFNRIDQDGDTIPEASDFDGALIRAIYDPATFSYQLELVMEVGSVIDGVNSGLPYRIDFLGSSESAGGATPNTIYASNMAEFAWNGTPTSGLDTEDTITNGGLFFGTQITYDTQGDGRFNNPTSANFDPGLPSDEAYSVGLYVGYYADGPEPCAADLNGDTGFDFFDISFLLQNQVDFNGDTGFDFFDISAFLQAGANCP